jgi:hypothetical protein
MVSWMLLGLCIPSIGCSQNVMQQFSNTFKLLNQISIWVEFHKVDDQDMMVRELINANELDCQ